MAVARNQRHILLCYIIISDYFSYEREIQYCYSDVFKEFQLLET
jgi:hypothetical protein